MKPFNILKAIKGETVINRKGEIVKIDYIRLTGKNAGTVDITFKGDHSPYQYDYEGMLSVNGVEHDMDLFMAPKKQKVWIAIHKNKEYDFEEYKGYFKVFAHLDKNIASSYLEGLDHQLFEIEIEIDDD